MSLAAGSRFGPYEIVSVLGAGGMGEVYRARDPKLQRDVALKVLPEHFASDPERVARFEREACTLASLNHPNIAHVYGFEQSGTLRAIAMELVEGPTLDGLIDAARRRSASGLGVTKALDVARQVASAMEAAHGQGILHRDLKPANISIVPDGTVKVLDFGLATAMREAHDSAGAMPTEPALTHHGIVMGTPAYMSPEQARGDAVDRRTDVWAFGCVLFEMLTLARPFDGRTPSDTVAALLTREPDWSKLPSDTPAAVVKLLRRCLQKDAHRRLRDLGDARLEIEDATAEPPAVMPTSGASRARSFLWGGAAAVAILASLGSGYLGWRLREPAASHAALRRFSIPLPLDSYEATLNQGGVPFAISPDGQALVYAAGSFQGSHLYVRRFDTEEPTVIPGTLGASTPFFSPDGEWIGFGEGRSLRRVPLRGGPVATMGEAQQNDMRQYFFGGATWTDVGIFFAADLGGRSGIARISPGGGGPELVVTVDRNRGESAYRWPSMLPGNERLIFTVESAAGTTSEVVIHSLATGERRSVLPGATRAQYVGTGHLVYSQGDRLLAVPFDLDRRAISGPHAEIAPRLSLGPGSVAPQFATSDDGMLVYVRAVRRDERALVWVDRQGRSSATPAALRGYDFVSLSPDGSVAAVRIREGARADLWRIQPDTGTPTRITFSGGVTPAVWTPDGTALVYAAPHEQEIGMFWQSLAGATSSQLLFTNGSVSSVAGLWPGSWFPDGRRLAFMHYNAGRGGEISVFERGAATETTALVTGAATEWGARLAPDGRSIAYVSNESGRWQVFLQALPAPSGRVQISTEGGTEVVWSRNGRELFYRNGPRMMAFEPGSSLSVGRTTVLFERPSVPGEPGLPSYDVAPDGRFIMVQPGPEERDTQPLQVILNWPDMLKRAQ